MEPKQKTRAAPSPSQKTAALIRAAMGAQKKTTTDLAEHLGLSTWSASRRINGHHRFTLEEVETTAAWLGLDPAELIHRDRGRP